MFELIVIIIMLIGIFLIGAVLIQPGKGDLTAGFGGVGGQLGSMFGMRKTTDLLTKITIGFAVAIVLLTVTANKLFLPQGTTEINPVTKDAQAPTATPQPSAVPSAKPQGGQPQQQQAPPQGQPNGK